MAHFRKRRRPRPRLGEGRKRPAPQPEPTPEYEYEEEDFEIEEFEEDYEDDFEDEDAYVEEEPQPQRRKVAKKRTAKRQAPGRQGTRRQSPAKTTRRSPTQRSSRLQSRGVRDGTRGGVRRGIRGSQEERGGRYGGFQAKKKTPVVSWISLGAFFLFLILFGIAAASSLELVEDAQGDPNNIDQKSARNVGALGNFALLVSAVGFVCGIIGLFQKRAPKGVAIAGTILNGLIIIWPLLGILLVLVVSIVG